MRNLIVILSIILVFVGISAGFAYGTKDTITVTVTGKERIVEGGEKTTSKYLVFTNGETFENTDSLWYGKWNSSDLYGRLEIGQEYEFEVYGWRLSFFSTYRNVVKAVPQ